MRMIRRCMWVLGLLAMLSGVIGPVQRLNAAPAKATWLNNVELQASTKFHCGFANEDVVGGGNWGIGGVRISSMPNGMTAKGLAPFFAKNLPGYKVWRDRVNKSVIHIVDRRVLAWKNNPLDKKVTIQGTMSIAYLQSHVFKNKFPNVHFYDMPYHRVNPIPYFPNVHAFNTPIKFDVKNITLRQFLTTGIPYGTNSRKLKNGLWNASYQFQDEKLTRKVTVIISGNPVVSSPTASRSRK